MIASGDNTGQVYLRLTSDPSSEITFAGSGKRLTAICFSPDSKQLATGGNNGTIDIWDTSNLLREGGGPLLPGEQHARGAADGQDVSLNSSSAGFHAPTLLKTLKAHLGEVRSLLFSSDGGLLASWDTDGTAKLWDLQNPADWRFVAGQKSMDLIGGDPSEKGFWRLAFSPDGELLVATAPYHIGAQCWNIGLRESVATWMPPNQAFGASVAFSPDGRYLALDNRNEVQIWDRRRQQLVTTWSVGSQVASLAVSPRGKYVAAGLGKAMFSGRRHSSVRVWDVEKSKEIDVRLQPFSHSIPGVAFTSNGRLLVATSHLGEIKVWNTSTWELERTMKSSSSWSLAASPDERTVATGSWDGEVTLWDIKSGTKKDVLAGQGAGVKALAFSPDGRTLASAGTDHTVVLWDVATGMSTRKLRGHSDAILGLAFSPDGDSLASAGWDGTLRLWETAPLANIDRHPLSLRSLVHLGRLRNTENRFADAELTLRWALESQRKISSEHSDLAATRIELATALLGQGKQELAVAELTEGLVEQPENYALLKKRAEAHLYNEAWEESALDEVLAASIIDDPILHWFHAAVLFLMAENNEGYRRVCRKMEEWVELQGENSISFAQAEQITKTCLLSPGTLDVDALPYSVIVDSLNAGTADFLKQWTFNTMTLVAYRRQEYALAEDWIQQAYELRKSGVVDKGWANLLLLEAMTAHQRGRDVEAEEKMAQARQFIEEFSRIPSQDAHGSIGVLRDLFMAEILSREAEELIHKGGGAN